jgi:hypothetical protein
MPTPKMCNVAGGDRRSPKADKAQRLFHPCAGRRSLDGRLDKSCPASPRGGKPNLTGTSSWCTTSWDCPDWTGVALSRPSGRSTVSSQKPGCPSVSVWPLPDGKQNDKNRIECRPRLFLPSCSAKERSNPFSLAIWEFGRVGWNRLGLLSTCRSAFHQFPTTLPLWATRPAVAQEPRGDARRAHEDHDKRGRASNQQKGSRPFCYSHSVFAPPLDTDITPPRQASSSSPGSSSFKPLARTQAHASRNNNTQKSQCRRISLSSSPRPT